MKSMLRPLLLMLPALLVGACSTHPQPASDARASTVDPVQTYVCASGARIVAAYPDTDSATVQYKGATYRLRIAISGSGARYVGERIEWWTKGTGTGSAGTLLRHNADGTSGDALEHCTGE